MRMIKRYSNRKMYDTTEKHYVTLAGVASTIRQGEDVEVKDYATGKDLTAQTLAQIIFEEEKRAREPMIAIPLYTKILREGLTA